jgi:3-hydroxyisobutyrate dehydrogenase-like beta-hydroxyacid dehydrogenase
MIEENKARLALIGFGEVGQRFSGDLLRGGGLSIATYDIVFDDPARRAELLGKAEAIGVRAEATPASAAAGADVVISAVTASAAEAVAKQAASYLKPGQVFLDVNSAAPSTKKRAAAHVEAVGAHYVEGAVMAAVARPGIRVPILAGGRVAAETAERLNALGMNLTPVAVEHGRASAMKLCRSIMIKGIEALVIDCAAASKAWDVETEVLASLSETFPSIDWPAQVAYMSERVATHGIRRASEMREAAEMLSDLGRDPGLCLAVAAAQQRGATKENQAA